MKKLFPIWALLMLGNVLCVNAQTDAQPTNFTNNNQPTNSLSGNSTNSFNVDLYTGTANVTIPIYNYSVDGIDAGISLSYGANGIKVDQLASSIGLGWNLNAGASITRQVNGIEDEATLPAIGPWSATTPPWPGTPQMSGAWSFAKAENDNDIFTINFGNHSVDFILKFTDPPPQNTAISPGQPFLIGTSNNTNLYILPLVDGHSVYDASISNTNSSNTYRFDASMETQPTTQIMSFMVIDETGNKYFFERGDYEYKAYVDTTVSPRVTHMYYPIDKWNITKIITWKGTTINYKYNNYNNVTYALRRYKAVKEVKAYADNNNLGNNTWHIPEIRIVTDSMINWIGTLSQISEIDYPNGVVATFHAGPPRIDLGGATAAYTMQDITLEGKYDAHVDNKLKYQFLQSYFTTTGNVEQANMWAPHDSLGYRLKLTGIDRYGTDLLTHEPFYRFTYNTATVLPQRLAVAQDLYGYYNGIFTGSVTYVPSLSGQYHDYVDHLNASIISGIPYHTYAYSYGSNNYSISYGIDKSSNINYAQACILTSMTNGLGGTTSFFYKDHVLVNPPTDVYSQGSNSSGTWPILTGPHYYSFTSGNSATNVIPGNNNPTLGLEFPNVNDGVCIDHIQTTDGYNSDNNTDTRYTFSGGMRFFPGAYFWYPTINSSGMGATTVYTPDNNGNTDYCENSWLERYYTNSPVSSQDQINGACHGYSSATVTTLGSHGEQVSSRTIKYTNIIGVSGEFDSIIINKPAIGSYQHYPAPVGYSRIRAACGIFLHTLPRMFMEKHLMGLPKEIDDYDVNNHLTRQTTNLYTESLGNIGGIGDISDVPGSQKIAAPMTMSSQYPYWPTRYFVMNDAPQFGFSSTMTYYRYVPFSQSLALLKSSTTSDYASGVTLTTTKNYQYDTCDRLGNTLWTDSKGNSYYTGNGNVYEHLTLSSFYTTYTLYRDLGTTIFKGTPVSTTSIISGSGYFGRYYPPDFYSSPISASFPLYTVDGALTYRLASIGSTPINDYKYYTKYDGQNNVAETQYKNGQEVYSALWDNRIGKKVASVVNSAYTDMAYTSFEGAFSSGLDSNKGHWNFDATNVVFDLASNPMTGKYYYNANAGVTSEYPLVSGKAYYLSFWMQGTPNVLINTTHGLSVSVTSQNTVNGWTLYTANINGAGATLTVSSSGAGKLDELRLYPADATMETFTYEPLLGVSSHCDDRNNITYLEYDIQGRATVTRDINKNIITLSRQVNQNSDN